MQNSKFLSPLARWISAVDPIVLLCMGSINFFAFLFQSSLYVRFILVCMFFVLASSQKRIRIAYYVFFIISIIFFSLLLPNGKVLYSMGPLHITQGALEEGLFRGITLSAYVLLSLWAVSPRLSLPGYGGKILSISLRLFSILFEGKGRELRKSFKHEDKKQEMKDKNSSETASTTTQKQVSSLSLFVKVDMLLCSVLEEYHMQQTQQEAKNTDTVSDSNAYSKYCVKDRVIGTGMLIIVSIIAWSFVYYTIVQ